MQQTGNLENAIVYQTDNFFIMDLYDYEKEKQKNRQFDDKHIDILRNFRESIQYMTQDDIDDLNERIEKYINENKGKNTKEDK